MYILSTHSLLARRPVGFAGPPFDILTKLETKYTKLETKYTKLTERKKELCESLKNKEATIKQLEKQSQSQCGNCVDHELTKKLEAAEKARTDLVSSQSQSVVGANMFKDLFENQGKREGER